MITCDEGAPVGWRVGHVEGFDVGRSEGMKDGDFDGFSQWKEKDTTCQFG